MKLAIIEGVRPTLMPEGAEIERKILGLSFDIKRYGLIKPEEYKTVLEDLDAVIVRPGTPFSKEMVFSLKRARIIVSLGVGYDHICLEAANEKHIPVCNVPDYGTEEVADSTVAMILAHQRKIFLFNYCCDSSDTVGWDWRIHIPNTRTRHVQVGIIGLGRIGTAVALRLKAFGCKIAFYDPYLPRGTEKSLGLKRFHQIEQLLRSSDVISVHAPLTRETTGMIDKRFLEILKDKVILINTARGGIFKNVKVVYDFMRIRTEVRVGTDVWPDEPPDKNPLLDAWRNRETWLGDRLIVCPHSAFYSDEAIREIRAFAAEIVLIVLRGGKPYNVVNGVNS